MKEESLRSLLEGLSAGDITVEEVLAQIKSLPFRDLEYAKVDHHRLLRRGIPEVIFCENKTEEQIAGIGTEILKNRGNLLATRCSREKFSAVSRVIPDAEYHAEARLFRVEREPSEKNGRAVVVSAGTSDMPVAEEAVICADFFGCEVQKFYDVGVAGMHRFLSCLEDIRSGDVVIVVAGMEGALASVVAGMVDAPVIAVPTSVGYGASFNGVAALLTMLNSCAGGVSVVNIDNGFGAAFSAALICGRIGAARESS
ncbi:MAG: nickel pincer cofactor biosynthesis protein LarB [Candidatus Latescibacteria bacterium]|nr:nickel pincer cofactor biosynthesis protein LarB [bacterium]MBD3423884.1 nickel pincer cofactor biosynthesis protein LarB [Candidatus Latescibacterota bacterium]